MTTQNDAQPAGADLSAEELVKQALSAMAALGLIQAPQRVSETYTRGFREQTIDGAVSSSNNDVEYWKANTAHRVANMIESAQVLVDSIATRDYLMAGPSVEDLREQLASVNRTIEASVPGDQDDRIYGSLWVCAVELQERIEAAEAAITERDPVGLPRTGAREDVIVLASESPEKTVLRALKTKIDTANGQQETPEQQQQQQQQQQQ